MMGVAGHGDHGRYRRHQGALPGEDMNRGDQTRLGEQ